jgi:phosphoenolpyruvate---glycerone phosphotransferase subunit DhaL
VSVAIDQPSVQRWIELFALTVAEHRQELIKLDTAIGDGDHGSNMDRGMQKAVEKLHAEPQPDPGAILKTVAMTLISTVGGAAGPLYGTLFLQLGGGLADHPEGDIKAYAAAWRRALDGVQSRGKAQAGDKTMLDALIPAVEALEQASELNAGLRVAADAAREGMLATTPLVARRGRASYLAERSAGHQDPGATSTHYLFESAAEALAD